jgi:hypothetical protein
MRNASYVLVALIAAAGCRLGDTSTPVPQPDTLIFGRVAAIRPVAGEPGVSEVEVQAGLPATLREVMRRENRPIPGFEKDLLVRARVNADSLCVADMRPTDLEAFRVGQEITIVPRPGTSAMVGTRLLLAEVAEIYQFQDYQLRALPRSLPALPPAVSAPADPGRINSAGTERAPLPVAGGRVVYFAAGLLPALSSDAAPRGAVRPGMTGSDGKLAAWASAGGHRPFRVEWLGDRWAAPAAVELDGVPAGASARLTWVDATETACLVELDDRAAGRRLFAAARGRIGDRWGALTLVTVEGGGNVGDAQRFGSRAGALVWTLYDGAGSDLWLALQGQKPGPVDPRINTLGPEWAPRVGANNTLYFCRGERQLLFTGGAVEEVRLPGVHLRPLLEAAPASDGSLLFCRVPRYVPGEPDWDLAVSARSADGRWGAAVPLDEWRPAA